MPDNTPDTTSDETPIYPATHHLLRDLRIVVDRKSEDAIASLEACPAIADAGGRIRVGVLATLVDVIAGEMAIRSVLPKWTATSDLSVYVDEVPTSGRVEARSRILRAGRQTVVLEVGLRGGTEAKQFGVAHVGFAVLPSRNELQSGGHWAEAPETRTEFGLAGSGFEKPLLETLGFDFDVQDATTSSIRKVDDYVRNSLGAIQGGAVAILLEASAERFASAELAGPVRVRSLAIHYLKLGRVGPIRAVSRRIARTPGGVLLSVSLFDEGVDDVLLTVATIQVDEASVVA